LHCVIWGTFRWELHVARMKFSLEILSGKENWWENDEISVEESGYEMCTGFELVRDRAQCSEYGNELLGNVR